jgi:hypothetical protein
MTDPLTLLLGNQARVRLLRMFLFNPSKAYSVNEIIRRARLVRRTAKTELNILERAGITRKRQVTETVSGKKTRRAAGYGLNDKSPLARSLQTFLFETAPIDGKNLQNRLKGVGKIQVLVAAGVFMNEFDRRIDVLIGIEKLQAPKVESAIRVLEAELGVEIKYAAFATTDLLYRLGMQDKLTRDVFDYPHELLIDKVGVRDEIKRPIAR